LGVGTPCSGAGAFPRNEGRIQVRSIYPNRGILIENLWPAKPAGKHSAKSKFSEFNSVENYIQLLLIEHIWKCKKINKV
jgi:hypothetical protein